MQQVWVFVSSVPLGRDSDPLLPDCGPQAWPAEATIPATASAEYSRVPDLVMFLRQRRRHCQAQSNLTSSWFQRQFTLCFPSHPTDQPPAGLKLTGRYHRLDSGNWPRPLPTHHTDQCLSSDTKDG